MNSRGDEKSKNGQGLLRSSRVPKNGRLAHQTFAAIVEVLFLAWDGSST
jgi:hypothetical protein